jgi:hypothetical protein
VKAIKSCAAALAVLTCLLLVGPASASAFEILNFEGATLDKEGNPYRQAAGHPYEQTFKFTLPTSVDNGGNVGPDGNVKDVEIQFPPGFVGDPSAAATCTEAQVETLSPETDTSTCPDGAQVGLVELLMATGGSDVTRVTMPLWNLGAQAEVPSEFAYVPLLFTLHSRAFVRTGGDYGISIVMRDLPQPSAVVGADVSLWGVPSDPTHNPDRNRVCFNGFCFSEGHTTSWPRLPFVSNPTDCSQESVVTRMRADSWQEPGQWAEDQFSFPGPQNCGVLSFNPSFTFQPDNHKAGAPSGYSFDLEVPLNRNPDGLAVPPVKKVVATLPEGTEISPAGADGLEACTSAQAGIDNPAAQACPPTSAIGDASIETPLLPKPLQGTLYLAKPHDNPFGSLYAVYGMFEGFGTRIKLPGKVEADPQTGVVTATFDDTPQLPFTHLHMHFGGGSRAILTNPADCGKKTMTMTMDSWGGQSVTTSSSTTIDQSCAGGFGPGLEAGSKDPVAGKQSPFSVHLVRPENDQALSTIDITLPPGELADLRGIPYCSDAALAGISTLEGTGSAELANPACPIASQVGTATVAAGAGSTPLFVTGRVYLAGPYRGAPLSIAVVTPAISGPYDLGSVVIRNALKVDPVTTQVEAVSDPLPTILYGVPLGIRDVRINLDRPDFTVNPTSCEPMAVTSVITSIAGGTASPSSRFQVGECASLGFEPKLSLQLTGPTHRSAHPALKAVLKGRDGDANIGKAVVTLPKTEFLENAHIRTICTRVQYAADSCPKGSVYGYAKAWSPLLDKPLQGPVYLRSSHHTLPDLVASLDGQIHVDLAGRIDSVHQRIRNTFWAVPDAPVSKFVLTMKGGDKGLLVNNTELCKAKPRARAQLTGQNGKVSASNSLVRVGCAKKKH